MWRSEIRLWFVCFLCRTSPKRLKFNKTDIFMFKVKKKGLEKGLKSVQSWQLRHQNDANFVVLVSLSSALKLFYTLLKFLYDNSEQVNPCWHLLYSLPCIQKQSPRDVFQEKYSAFSQFTREHQYRSVSSTLLKSPLCMCILLEICNISASERPF